MGSSPIITMLVGREINMSIVHERVHTSLKHPAAAAGPLSPRPTREFIAFVSPAGLAVSV